MNGDTPYDSKGSRWVPLDDQGIVTERLLRDLHRVLTDLEGSENLVIAACIYADPKPERWSNDLLVTVFGHPIKIAASACILLEEVYPQLKDEELLAVGQRLYNAFFARWEHRHDQDR